MKCPIGCGLCSSDVSCSTCTDGHLLRDGQCVVGCVEGKFLKNGACLVCDKTCTTCNSDSACISCASGLNLNSSNQCVQECGVGFYEDNGKCSLCGTNCADCNKPGDDNCTLCKDGFNQQGSRCVASCSSGFFALNRVCTACSSGCGGCSDANTCSKCSTGYLSGAKCVAECQKNEYVDPAANACRPCDAICSSCDGPTTKGCKSCSDGYLMLSGTC